MWECHVIEGLEGGRFAIYLKVHHGQFDGIGAARLIENVLTRDAIVRDLLPPWAVGTVSNRSRDATGGEHSPHVPAVGDRGRVTQIVDGVGDLVSNVFSAATGTGSALTAFARMTSKIVLGGERSLTGPFQAPQTVFNRPISAQRRFATQEYDLSRFKIIAKTAGVTINDVFLAISGGAMRRYLLALDALPDRSVTGQVPVSLRRGDGGAVGNELGFIYARLHTEIADPVERLHAVRASTVAGKSVQEALPADALTPFTFLMTGPFILQVILGLSGHVPPAANLVISNVPGPRQTLYFNGARVDNIYGPSVLFHGQALNITMSSYTDRANVSFTGCRDSMPHMQRLAVYTGEALSELEAALNIAVG